MERKKTLKHYRDLEVYQKAFGAAMRIYHITKSFPVEEKYSLVDQIRRSSRAVCANLAEAWRKRKYAAVFKSKLPRPQGGALKPKFSKPKTEIPKQVRDDKRRRPIPYCHAELVSASDQVFSAFSRHTFHPRPQDGVFRCDF
jgi:hypothetical protein